MGCLFRLWPQGAGCMHIVGVSAALYNIVFVGGKEDTGRMNAADSNDPNVYVRDVVAVFKPFAGAHPPSKKISHH